MPGGIAPDGFVQVDATRHHKRNQCCGDVWSGLTVGMERTSFDNSTIGRDGYIDPAVLLFTDMKAAIQYIVIAHFHRPDVAILHAHAYRVIAWSKAVDGKSAVGQRRSGERFSTRHGWAG